MRGHWNICSLCSLSVAPIILGCAFLTGCAAANHDGGGTPTVKISDEERRMLSRLSYSDAARLQQSYVRLIADRYEEQLQQIANQIGRVSDKPDMYFRVHLINDVSPYTFSFPSGDIFISSGYIDRIVTNRDEAAFAIAREIAAQSEEIAMKKQKLSLILYDQARQAQFVAEMLTSITINSVYSVYFVGPMDKMMDKRIEGSHPPWVLVGLSNAPPPKGSPGFGRGPRGVIVPSPAPTAGLKPIGRLDPNFAESLEETNRLAGYGFNWIPQLVSESFDKNFENILDAAVADTDPDANRWKDEHGLVYMRRANFDDTAGRHIMEKLSSSGGLPTTQSSKP